VNGYLLSRDFNPLDIPPFTANGLSPDFLLISPDFDFLISLISSCQAATKT